MEALDPVAEFLVHASEVTVYWDDVTEYLFYGLVTIAIWLIIKVFIEISETRRPKNSVLSTVNTRRRLTEESVETILESSKKEEGHRSATKSGARVRFDLKESEGHVIGDVLTNEVAKETDEKESKDGKEENAEEGRGKMGEEEVGKVGFVEETNEELPEIFEKKINEEKLESISEGAVRKGNEPEATEITEMEENAEPESNFSIKIEELDIEVTKMKEYDEVVELITHESEMKECETPEDDEIGNEESGDKERVEGELGASEEFTVLVTKGAHVRDVKEETTAIHVQETMGDGVGDADLFEKEMKYVSGTEKTGVTDTDENVKRNIAHELAKEMKERHQNGIGYSEGFTVDALKMEINAEGKEICGEEEAEKTGTNEIDVTQKEDMDIFLKIRKNDGEYKIVDKIEKNTEEISGGTGEVTAEENSALNSATPAEVPQWYARVELTTNRAEVRDAAEFSTTKSLVKMFESLRESNFAEFVPFTTKRIRRHLSMPFVEGIGSACYGGRFDKRIRSKSEEAGEQGSSENGDVSREGILEENGSLKSVSVETTPRDVLPKEKDGVGANKAPEFGVRVTRSKSLRDWKEDLKLSYKAGEWRIARGLPFYERFEDPDREKLIQETFGAILKPTLCQREPVSEDVINRSYSPEERNLLKNNCGQNGLRDWISKFRLQDWNVAEDEEERASFPKDREGRLAIEFDGNVTFFEAISRNSRKEQEVDLISEGFSADFLDKEQPHISVSEWVKVQEHCKSTYEIRVKLLDKKKETISDIHKDLSFDVFNKGKWEKISHVFEGYGPGIRYVLFNHGAVKWSGTSGCRMTGAEVRVLNPT